MILYRSNHRDNQITNASKVPEEKQLDLNTLQAGTRVYIHGWGWGTFVRVERKGYAWIRTCSGLDIYPQNLLSIPAPEFKKDHETALDEPSKPRFVKNHLRW